MNKFRKQISIAAVGFASMGAQLIFLRELMPASLGDELSVGLSLFAWMLWTGIGSVAGGIISRKFKTSKNSTTAALLFLHAILSPLSVLWIRYFWYLSGRMYGELMPMDSTLFMALAVMAPFCLITGALFPVIMKSENERSSAGSLYAWDTVAAGVGGILFSLIIVPNLSPISSSVVAGAFTLLAGALWLSGNSRYIAVFISTLLVIAVIFFSDSLENYTKQLIWGTGFYSSTESGYGNITALKEDDQFSIYTSGRFSSNVPDTVFGEYMAHIPMLAHPAPKTVLLVGASETAAEEILKHGVQKLTVAEMDPAVLKLKIKLCGNRCDSLLKDKRITSLTGDPRRHIENTNGKYDVIIIDPGVPETLQLNRYYTTEFIRAVSKALSPGGLLALTVPFTENYTGDDRIALTGSIVATFPRTREGRPFPVPGPKTFLLWRPGTQQETSSEEAVKRFIDRKIISEHFNSDSAGYYFDSVRIEFALSQFSDNIVEYTVSEDRIGSALSWLRSRPGVAPNSDYKPVCVYYSTRSASEYYKSTTGKLTDKFKKITDKTRGSAWVLLIIIPLLVAMSFFGRTGTTIAATTGVAAAGFSGMLMEVLLLMEFQILNGVMYQYMGLIIGTFLFGTAAGSAINGAPFFKSRAGTFVKIIIPILFVLIPVANGNWLNSGSLFGRYEIMAWSFLAGMLPGWAFPESVTACNSHNGHYSFHAGMIYAADLAGACLAAISASALLLPLYGVEGCLGIARNSIIISAACYTGLSIRRLRKSASSHSS